MFTIRAAAPIRFTLSIRVPSWVKGSAGLSINGEKQALDIRPDTWLKVDRDWHDGDKLIFDFPYALAFSPVDAINSNIVALTYGPLALVSDEMTLLVGDVNRPEDWLKPVEGSFATFDTLPGHAGKQLFLTRRFSPYYQIGPMTWYFMYNRIYPDLESIPRRPWN